MCFVHVESVRAAYVQKLVMLPRKNSCSRDLASQDTMMAAASRLSAFRHSTVPMLSVSTSACTHMPRLEYASRVYAVHAIPTSCSWAAD